MFINLLNLNGFKKAQKNDKNMRYFFYFNRDCSLVQFIQKSSHFQIKTNENYLEFKL